MNTEGRQNKICSHATATMFIYKWGLFGVLPWYIKGTHHNYSFDLNVDTVTHRERLNSFFPFKNILGPSISLS